MTVRTIQLDELRAWIRNEADIKNQNFLGDDEIDRMINSAAAGLRDKLIQVDPDFFAVDVTITGDGVASEFDVPNEWIATKSIWDTNIGNKPKPLIRLRGISRYRYANGTAGYAKGWYPYGNPGAEEESPKIRLTPTPSAGSTYIHVYVFGPTEILADAGTFPAHGEWDEWIVLECAIRAMGKEHSPTAKLEARLARLNARLDGMIEMRAMDELGGTVIDVNDVGEEFSAWGENYDGVLW